MKVTIGRYPSTHVLKRNPNAEQKVDIRIDPWDTWNMAETLADIILPMLKQLRLDKQGTPCSMPAFEDESNYQWPQMCFDFYKEADKLANDRAHAQWEEIMDKMIWSFEQVVDRDRDSKFHSGNIDIQWDPIKDENGKVKYQEMKRGPNDTHKFDADGYKAYQARMYEGLELFGKYYMNLWD